MEYIFTIGKEELFEEIEDKIYFLIIFDNNIKNEIWKLGEPFISKYKFVFNQEQKSIGFYNPLLNTIPNSEYDLENINNNEINKSNYIKYKSFGFKSFLNNLQNIVLILRANELFDNFEYLPNGNKKILDNSFDIN